jgi:hypothetical protein
MPPQRQGYLVRFFGNTYGAEPEDVDQMVRDALQRPCPVPVPNAAGIAFSGYRWR